MSTIKAIAQSMLDSRLWDESEIFQLRDMCSEAEVNVDFGKIFDAYEGRKAEDFGDSELKKIINHE